jgi:hypothetical protein
MFPGLIIGCRIFFVKAPDLHLAARSGDGLIRSERMVTAALPHHGDAAR